MAEQSERTGQSAQPGQDVPPAPEPAPDLLGHCAMEFRRVARMNKHQLWSICVAWCRDRAAAAAVLSRGLTDAWAEVKTTDPVALATPAPGELPLSAQLTRVIYRCVLAAASGSLAADVHAAGRAEQSGTTGADATDAYAPLSPAEISLYVMASYSPLPTGYACELLGIDGDGVLDRVSRVLLRDLPARR